MPFCRFPVLVMTHSWNYCLCVSVCVQHLGCAVPDCVELQEMICESCMNKHLFLWTYAAHFAGTPAPPT